jgi:DNA modification methylase
MRVRIPAKPVTALEYCGANVTPWFQEGCITIYNADVMDALRGIESESIQCVVTSPPYWGLRDYGVDGQIGLEATPDKYVTTMVTVFHEVWRVLKDDGTLWLNMGDCYATRVGKGGMHNKNNAGKQAYRIIDGGFIQPNRLPIPGFKPKDLVGMPWRMAFALQADGWYLRSDIIWAKPNPMPESVKDRPTKAHEYLFLLTKQERYFYDQEAIMEPGVARNHHDATGLGYCAPGQTPQRGNRMAKKEQCSGMRNVRSVWTIAPQAFSGAHFATFPEALVVPCVKAGSREGDTVLDPFAGSGTVGLVAMKLGRKAILIDLNEAYCKLMIERIGQPNLLCTTEKNKP